MFAFIKKRRKRRRKKNVAKKKIGTLNIVLICIFVYTAYLNWQMLETYKLCGSAPETAWCALIAALLGECGICGWIRTNKDKQQDRKWEKEDRKKQEQNDANMAENEED